MKKYILIILLIIINSKVLKSQNNELSENWQKSGLSFIISESGFGLGSFYGFELSEELTTALDFSISGASDDREFEFIDYYGNKIVPGKKNRLFLMPLHLTLEYRLFKDDIVDNFKPHIRGGFGPAFLFFTPYKYEFFSSLKYGQVKYGLGGFIGIGIDFGQTNSYQGINLSYSWTKLFSDGVESLEGKSLTEIKSFYFTLIFGIKF